MLFWKIEDYADGFDLLWNSIKYECLYTSPNGDSLSLEVSFPNYNMYDDWSYNFVKIVKVPGRSHILLILTSNISRVPIITRILKSQFCTCMAIFQSMLCVNEPTKMLVSWSM